MGDDAKVRRRIIDAAAELFADHGYEGTRVRAVADRAGVMPSTVRRLTGGRSELFRLVIADKAGSAAARAIAEAANDPTLSPPLFALVDAGREVYAKPSASWDLLELEAVTRSHRDPAVRDIEASRIQQRWDNARTVIERIRRNGGVDADVDVDSLTHLALALSIGLAMLDPVVETRPRAEDWNALISRIASAVAPADMLLHPDHPATVPWRIRVDTPDRPGALASLVRALSTLHLYTVALQVVGQGEGTRTIDVALLAPAEVSAEAILAAALAAGSNGYVTEGSPDDAIDMPTRVLDLATALVTNPGRGPMAAADLVEADDMSVLDAVEGLDDRVDVLRLQWTLDRHVLLERSWAPFARAERTRASALLRLSAAVSTLSGDEDAAGWVEPVHDGTVWLRLGHPEDGDAVAAMHARCSDQTRYQRYFAVTEWRDVQLRRLSGGHRGATLVAMVEDGSMVGLGNVFPVHPGDDRTAEIAVLVEDAHQGRGIGTVLLHRMLRVASRLGFTEVVADVLAENAGMLHVLHATGLAWTTSFGSGIATLRAALPPDSDRTGAFPVVPARVTPQI